VSSLFSKPSTAKGAIDGFTHGSLRPRPTPQMPFALPAFDTALRALTLGTSAAQDTIYRCQPERSEALRSHQ
jgi:hypothetical protein